MDLEQQLTKLITPTAAARLKRMPMNTFTYRIKKDGAPRPVFVGEEGHVYYWKHEIAAWKPVARKAKPKQPKQEG